jgi:hypothetical protein
MGFKFEKLKIQAFEDAKRTTEIRTFEAQFNPTEIKWSYGINWDDYGAIVNADAKEQVYCYSDPTELSITLTFDGTSVDSYGLMALWTKSVKTRVKDFLKATYQYNGSIHQPPYLTLSWGSQDSFYCRLASADVKYTLFDRGGAPLRAEIAAKFVQDTTAETMARILQKESPDLTHSRVVRSGDTLPSMTHAIYGSSQRYLDVARYNGLDDFRSLKPGQVLLFPPLAVFTSAAGDTPRRG